jgi:hypothetical protein
MILRIGESQAARVRIGDTKLREIQWLDDDNLLLTVSTTSPPPIGFLGPTREWPD